MKNKAQTRTGQVLAVMLILAWLAFIGFAIEAGAILVSYGVSCANPEGARNLYKGLDLYSLRQFNFWQYTLYVFFLVALSIMKSLVSFQVIKTLSGFNLKNPFTMAVAQRLEKISYISFGTWVVTLASNVYTGWLMKITGKLYGNWLSGEFIFMVGLVFVISQVFKRGVEIQSENDLTV
jgi:Protein of unknown function (DUF2975)